MSDAVPQLKTAADAGKGPQGEVKRWLIELDYADGVEKDWRARAHKTVSRYRAEDTFSATDPTQRTRDGINILWSNVETMRPAIYNSTPEPVVTDRFGDADAVTKGAIEVLRRALKYTLTSQDFDQVMALAVQDYLLPGRAGVRVRYVPTFGPAEQSPNPPTPESPAAGPAPSSDEPAVEPQEPVETLAGEEIKFELIDWDGFRRGHAEVWDDLPWVAFELDMTYDDLVALVGRDLADQVPLSARDTDDDGEGDDEDEGVFKTAEVYEIWDRKAREVLWIAPAFADRVLKRVKDEYGLRGFFPMPRMMYAVETSDSLVPATEFSQYEALADQLDILTKRMKGLAESCMVRGMYPKDMSEIRDLFNEDEGAMIAVDNADRYAEMGGLERAISFIPLDKIVQAYQGLSAEREAVKQAIFELIGAADIMRGATEAVETASAQKLKSRWGSVRLRRRQAEIERFCRDLLSIAAEVISDKFSIETLRAMTGCKYPMLADKQQAQMVMGQIQQAAQQAQQGGMQVPPQVAQQGAQMMQQAQHLLSQPAWEEIIQFLRSDAMRRFRIDVQTDSTVALQNSDDQQEFGKMLEGLGAFISQLMPLVASGSLPFDAAKSMIIAASRKFRLGYEVADELEQMAKPPQPDPMQSPDGMKLKATMSIEQMKVQASAQSDQQKAQADMARIEREFQIKQEEQKNELALQQSNDQRQQALDQQKHQLEMQKVAAETHKAEVNAQQALVEAQIRALAQVEVARVSAGIDNGENFVAALGAIVLPGLDPTSIPPTLPPAPLVPDAGGLQ